MPLRRKIWPDMIMSAIRGCHLCSLALGSSWNAGEGPFDLFRWLRCTDRTGELEMAMWNPIAGDQVDAASRPYGTTLCGLQLGEELTFDAEDDILTSWSNIWLFERDQPRLQAPQGPGFPFTSSVEGPPPTPLCPTTGDAESLQLCSWWLRRCRTKHAACSAAAARSVGLDRPARLLHVGVGKRDGDLRLFPNTDPSWRPEYVALSYCWGTTRFQHLTSQNISEYLSKIDYFTLPKTIQDAVDVTRWLGFSYLWIDALCIIQDSKEDWATESVKMGQVYGQAVLTIAALGAQDSSRGCFLKRNPLCLRDCPIPGTDLRLASTSWTMKREYQIAGRFASPLQTRAWVVQEEYSATRTLYFGSSGLWWQCITCEATESQPFGNLSQGSMGTGDPEGRFRTVITPNGFAENIKYRIHQVLTGNKASPGHADQFKSLWRDILKRYTSCKLTYQSDKLVAISGIASLFEKNLRLEYKVGLWVANLLTELLWSSETTSNNEILALRRSTSGAPSFSWAAVEQPIRPFDRTPTLELEAESIELIEQTDNASATTKGVLLKAVSQLKRGWLVSNGNSGPTGSPALFVLADDGEIEPPAGTELDIPIVTGDGEDDTVCFHFKRKTSGESSGIVDGDLAQSQKRITYPWVPDISLDAAPTEAWYMCLGRHGDESLFSGTVGLMLTPVDSSRRRWTRIGFMIHETLPLSVGKNVVTNVQNKGGSASQRLTDRHYSRNPFQIDSERALEEILIA